MVMMIKMIMIVTMMMMMILMLMMLIVKVEGYPHKFCSPSGHFQIESKGSRCKDEDFIIMTLVIKL